MHAGRFREAGAAPCGRDSTTSTPAKIGGVFNVETTGKQTKAVTAPKQPQDYGMDEKKTDTPLSPYLDDVNVRRRGPVAVQPFP